MMAKAGGGDRSASPSIPLRNRIAPFDRPHPYELAVPGEGRYTLSHTRPYCGSGHADQAVVYGHSYR